MEHGAAPPWCGSEGFMPRWTIINSPAESASDFGNIHSMDAISFRRALYSIDGLMP